MCTANIIYSFRCPVCDLQYDSDSKQPFHKRLNGHRSKLTEKPLLPIGQHFRLPNHDLEDFNKMQILIVEQNMMWSDPQRLKREGFWKTELRALLPHGINKKYSVIPCFYSLFSLPCLFMFLVDIFFKVPDHLKK